MKYLCFPGVLCVCTTNLHQLGMKNAAVATSSFFAPGYNPAICTQRSEGAKRGLFEGGGIQTQLKQPVS